MINSTHESTPLLDNDPTPRGTRPRDALVASNHYLRIRKHAYDMVEGTIDSAMEYFILILIFLNVVSFMAGTVIVDGTFLDGVCVSDCVDMNAKYDKFFEGFELFSVIVFTIEYIMRIWAAMENPKYHAKGSIWGRISYACTFFCLVDLVSILPYWLNIAGLMKEVDFSSALRGFRLVRFLKADKYLNAFSLLGSVLYENGPLCMFIF
jgi:voltage-gated potassium channel